VFVVVIVIVITVTVVVALYVCRSSSFHVRALKRNRENSKKRDLFLNNIVIKPFFFLAILLNGVVALTVGVMGMSIKREARS
jgi:hypothetical protein